MTLLESEADMNNLFTVTFENAICVTDGWMLFRNIVALEFDASLKTLSTVYETRGQLITLPERGHCKDYYHITHVYDFYQQVVTALLLISFLLYGILLSEHKPTKYRNRE